MFHHQSDVDAHTGLVRQTLAQQFEIAVIDPVAEKLVRCLDGYGSSINAEKVKWGDPGLETNLAQPITHPDFDVLPQPVH